MKKGTVLNADISAVISRLGHTDTLVVCDAGLPVPRSSTRIDMALTQGVPSFMQVLEVVTTEDEVKRAADYVTDSVDEDGVEKALRHFGVI